MEYELYKMESEEKMEIAISDYQSNISRISTGRANPAVLNSLKVDYYGTPTPINELASISVPEPRQLLIKPFDININKEVAGIINKSNLGVRGVDEGDKVRITFPELTTERRRELVKSLSQYTEQAKIKIRSSRQDANKQIKASDYSEDDERFYLEDIQKMTDKYTSKIDELLKSKEKDLMTL